jgi:membrane associated rhomboid family serine protease
VWFVPLYDDNPIARTAVLTSLLIAIWAERSLGARSGRHHGYLRVRMIPAELFGYWHPGSIHQAVPAWAKVLTSMFTHGGWLHLIEHDGSLGLRQQHRGGARRTLPVPLFLLRDRGGAEPSLLEPGLARADGGASGAIAGVTGAYLLLFPRANVRCFVWIVFFLRIVNVPAWFLLGAWFAAQIVSGLTATLLRPSGVELLQPARSRVFATARLRADRG